MAALPVAALVLNPLFKLLRRGGKKKLANVKIVSSKVDTRKFEKKVKRDIRRNGIFQETQDVLVKHDQKAMKVTFRAKVPRGLFDKFFSRFERVMSPALERIAEKIHADSIPFVPFDTGRLEATGRVVKGKHSSNSVSWFVGYGPAIDPETGTDYSLFMEFGQYNRGPGTVAKGPEAGPLFLTRAVDENRKLAIKRMRRNLAVLIRGL